MSADRSAPAPVDPAHYTEDYFLEDVGGAEFYRLYGPRVVSPVLAYALSKARLEPGMRALDIGCGRGEILYQLERKKVSAVGFVLANTCTNTEYYKRLTYATRRRLSRALGLKDPSAMRSPQDEKVHVNEHSQKALEDFFARIGWHGEVEARPNNKLFVRELYGENLPPDFPMRPAPRWKTAWARLAFRGPWKRFLAREFFCVVSPAGGGKA